MRRHRVLSFLNFSLMIMCVIVLFALVRRTSSSIEYDVDDKIIIDYTDSDHNSNSSGSGTVSKAVDDIVSEVKMDDVVEPLVATKLDVPYMEMSEDDAYELATLVYLEAGIESYECQKAVASVVINRMNYYGWTLQQVIYEPYQFEPAYNIPYNTPSQSCIDAVNDVLQNGVTLPEYVTYFRANHYFNWGDRYVNYIQIDRTYFSYDTWIKAACEGT